MGNLSKKQECVLRHIFELKKTEEEALTEAKIARKVYDGWFRQEQWIQEYGVRIRACQRTSDLTLATYKEVAAVKLVTLTECEKPDVQRRACLDIIERQVEVSDSPLIAKKMSMQEGTQAKIMQILADERCPDSSVAPGG